MAQFNPGGSSNQTSGPTRAAGTADTSHQFSGSVNISGTICLSTADNLSGSLAGPGSYLGLSTDGCLAITTAGGGGGGGGISWDGSTANGIATFKDADEATVESKLTFDGTAELLSLTGAIIQTGSTATFFVADGQEDAFVISGSTGGFNPSLGLMNVDTSKQTVRFGGGVNIPSQWGLNFGTLDGESNGEAKISYGGVNLIISGASGGNTRVTGSVEFAHDVIIAGTLQGGSPLEISGGINLSGSQTVSGTMIVSGALAVSGNTIHNYGDFYNYSPNDNPTFHITSPATQSNVFLTGTLEHTGAINLSGTLTITGGDTTPMLVLDDTDGAAQIGRAHIGYVGSGDFAAFAHQDNANTSNYCISQRSTGQTDINTRAGTNMTFRYASAVRMQLDQNGGIAIGSNYAPGAYKFDVSGSARLGTNINSTDFVVATGSLYVGTPTSTTLTVNSGDGAITINANTGGSSGVTINGPTSLSGSDQYEVLLVEAAQRTKSGGDPVLVAHKDGVGIGVGSPKLELDVAYSTATDLSADEGGGERVYFGTASGPTVAGALYYLNEAGGWDSASADATGSGNSSLLGISIGTDPEVNGMLIRGFFNVSTYYEGAFATGSAVYIHSGASGGVPVKGKMSGAAPNAADSYARIVGYGTSNYNVIYFNPGTNWVELS